MSLESLTVQPPVEIGELSALFSRLADGAAERERLRVAPFEQVALVRDAGLGRLRIPIEEGGAGVSLPELFKFLIDLAAADSNVAHILRVHFAFVEQQIHNPNQDERSRWLALVNENKIFGNAASEQSRKAVGLTRADSGIETTLTPEGDHFRLSGIKYYSTGTLFSDWTGVDAVKPDGTVAAAVIPVDREGVTVEDDWDGFGQRLTGTGTTRLENVYVFSEEVSDYGAPGEELPASYQGAFLQLYLQAVTAGILRAAVDDASSLVRRRVRNFSHAVSERPADDPQVLQVVGEMAADAFAAEAIVLQAARALQAASDSSVEGRPTVTAMHQAQLASASAKVAIDRFSYATAARLFDAGGASATQAPHNLDRHWRNVRTISTHNPTFLKATAIGAYEVNGTPPPHNGYF